ncbi:MAG: undecaprenyldiphospho-muramoylpentapeptide beta-N-acetylglucosaminyltransferase [Candidatus Gracilibacteria bacterium]|nr:undecaprenyldiphospho-muramoylpentapeptide beta-N-acetylglucosaminyltransferase [Candidatus Gracilibacteria bacterium]MDD5179035.1 undecaprenyldiphospho-muramoylpentapeptide beta-N-acetylglucosaminyltransferase [Candidatus Gracilibacteria bacterium]
MKIVFTGGGTGGHVIPNLAVIAALKKFKPRAEIVYIGCRNSIEEQLVKEAGLKFFAVKSGKLRRYFSLRNLTDAAKIPVGILQAIRLLRRLKPDAVFAKGGYVSIPTAVAAGILKIPLIIHESDATFGLATKIAARFASKICVSFATTQSSAKTILTGNPIRQNGNAARGKKFLKFGNRKPIVLITGGSSGASFLNRLVELVAKTLGRKVNLVWITGGQISKPLKFPGLRVFDFLRKEYLDVLAASDLVVSRAGANAIMEIAAAGKPSLLIPLPREGSRGDQILNAKFFRQAKAAEVIYQETLTAQEFIETVLKMLKNKKQLKQMGEAAVKLSPKDAAQKIAKIILDEAKN